MTRARSRSLRALVQEIEVEIPSGGDICRAWLFLPESLQPPVPCIVMGHGFGLTRRCGLRDFAVAFAKAGHAVLVFDYRGFGDSTGEPRQLLSFSKQLDDWAAVVAYARGRTEIDSGRIVTWGFSLGGGHALTVAVCDRRIAAVVSVVPMLDGLSSTLAAMRGWSLFVFLRMVGRAGRDLARGLFGRTPLTVPLAASPGEFGILTSAGTFAGYQAIVPRDFRYDLAARIALYFWVYIPGLSLRRFRRPALLLPSRIDEVNPPRPTLRRAHHCKTATVVELDCAHMDAVLEPHRSRVVAATLSFLDERLGRGQVE